MPISQTDKDNQDKLKTELQSESKASKLEHLAAALIGKLLGLSIPVAKSGFQHGGDAGPAGKQGRRFRLECKKYSDATNLSERELLGEIDQALSRDPALEAWFLVTTRDVPEQLAQSLLQHGEREGIPILIIDWKNNELAPLAALCSADPDLVTAEFSKDAGDLARSLQSISAGAIDLLRREMQGWCLGFESICTKSHKKALAIWNSAKTSQAELGQNVAGGTHSKKIKRARPCLALDNWWDTAAATPAAIFGREGVGKTWTILNWLVDHLDTQPIVLIVPSSSAATLTSVSETKIKQFLAERLYELSEVRDTAHWLRRLDLLLKRPSTEGPVLTIFFDGLNQESSVPWLQLLKTLQGECFAGKVRAIVSTRQHHFENKLASLRGLTAPAETIEVDVYDTEPNGELDQMLAFEGLTRADLHPDLIELARTPRLFSLVIKFRDRLVEAGQVTVHRLLWEYGRDTLGIRAGTSFSEHEWQEWLKEIAQRYRDGSKEYTTKTLGDSISRADLTEKEVYARLSDIIDGRFAIHGGVAGRYQLAPAITSHALAVALLTHLGTGTENSFDALQIKLEQWLDPIAGLDERAEILRASVSVLVEQQSRPPILLGLLVTAWLQTQNVSDAHRKELAALSSELVDALLVAVEQSESHTHASARLWAVNALRAIPRDNSTAATEIVTRMTKWFSVVSRDVAPSHLADEHSEKHRSERLMHRIGTDRDEEISVCGMQLELIGHNSGTLQMTAPSVLEGLPLAMAMPVFAAAAATLAIRDRCEGWDGLKWLCLLNKNDPDATTTALRALSKDIQLRQPKLGVHAGLPARIAALLLRLTGQEQDDEDAIAINPHIDAGWTYENYLQNPARSFRELERRHAEIVLNDVSIKPIFRAQRIGELWDDPDFAPTAYFVGEAHALSTYIDVNTLNRHSSYTIEDHDFEKLEPVFARCTPKLLGDMMRTKLQGLATCPPESRYWCSIHVTDHLGYPELVIDTNHNFRF